jgi:ATP-dependent Lhr-like helicase
LWQQRKRAADLLSVASRYERFPILLETYRECVRDVFDLPAAVGLLRRIERGEIRVSTVDSVKPSPFASSLLFSYIANYIYEGDAPLAERRAQALSIDQAQLQELLGDTDLRELLDAAALDEVEAQLQFLDPEMRARSTDAVHDLLIRLGDLSQEELQRRSESDDIANTAIKQLTSTRRALRIRVAGEPRYVAVEDAARYRDALGIPLPPGLAEAFLVPAKDPLLELVRRYARRHGPFTTADVAARFSLTPAAIEPVLKSLHAAGRVLEGEFRPDGTHREWVDAEVLRSIRQKSLARLRREIEPVAQHIYARFSTRWQGVHTQRRGPAALADAIEILQGAALPVSDLEREILPARVLNYRPEDLDALIASGQVTWTGVERIGERDGRIALYLTPSLPLLYPRRSVTELSERAQQIVAILKERGASFFAAIHQACGGGFPGETTEALWELVWAGLITNDTFHPLRNLRGKSDAENKTRVHHDGRAGSPEFLLQFRRRNQIGGSEGRWSLLASRISEISDRSISDTEWAANTAQQMLIRYGIVTRESSAAEGTPGGYATLYPALKQMEESGWIRRGMFVGGLGAAQFAMPAAVDLLRSLRVPPRDVQPEAMYLAATDAANPYGAILPWPRATDESAHGMARTSGAAVVLVDGALTAFLRRNNPAIRVFLPDDEPERTTHARALSAELARAAMRYQQTSRYGMLIADINNGTAREHFLSRFLVEAGFVDTAQGFHIRRKDRRIPFADSPEPEDASDQVLEDA